MGGRGGNKFSHFLECEQILSYTDRRMIPFEIAFSLLCAHQSLPRHTLSPPSTSILLRTIRFKSPTRSAGTASLRINIPSLCRCCRHASEGVSLVAAKFCSRLHHLESAMLFCSHLDFSVAQWNFARSSQPNFRIIEQRTTIFSLQAADMLYDLSLNLIRVLRDPNGSRGKDREVCILLLTPALQPMSKTATWSGTHLPPSL